MLDLKMPLKFSSILFKNIGHLILKGPTKLKLFRLNKLTDPKIQNQDKPKKTEKHFAFNLPSSKHIRVLCSKSRKVKLCKIYF